MKFTAEQRKHLVTRTFTENTVTYVAYNFTENVLENHTVTVGGTFKDNAQLAQYIVSRYSTQECAINPVSVKSETKEVKYGMYDSDFMKYGFRFEDEGDKEEQKTE